MRVRFVLLALSAALGSATPLTLQFVGYGSGSLNGEMFTNQSFTFTFDTDTDVLFAPPYPGTTDDTTTPDISGTFTTTIDGMLVTATLSDLGVYDNPSEQRLGLWNEATDQDWLTITASPFASYNLMSSYSFDASGSEVTALAPVEGPVITNLGPLEITSATTLDFTATVTGATTPAPPTPGVATVPEPSTASLLLVGTGGILAGLVRRKRV